MWVLEALALGTAGFLVGKLLGLVIAAWIDNAPYCLPSWMSPFERVFAALTRAIAVVFDGQLRLTRALARSIGRVAAFRPR
ncbi:hypothetical protein SEA_OPIE_42 [Gordonia phage Opie]|nr:hypothetical protein SEA_OPIE_42 [Gordonia phage Opie]